VYKRQAPDHPTHCLIAETKGGPFGYLQWYLNRSYPSHGVDLIAEPKGVSLDYFIGDPACLGRQLGSAMLSAALGPVAGTLAPDDRLFFVLHHAQNHSAIRCSELAGFSFRKRVWDHEEEHHLLMNNNHFQTTDPAHVSSSERTSQAPG